MSKAGIELIADERQRQIDSEGWTADHDDEHTDGSLAFAAICYAAPDLLFRKDELAAGNFYRDPWPNSWDRRWDKRPYFSGSRDNVSNTVGDPDLYTDEERLDLLVKSGALIAAEIDRLQRAGHTAEGTEDD